MSDSYNKYFEEVELYQYLCKELKVEPKSKDVDYRHLSELKKDPRVQYKNWQWAIKRK